MLVAQAGGIKSDSPEFSRKARHGNDARLQLKHWGEGGSLRTTGPSASPNQKALGKRPHFKTQGEWLLRNTTKD